MKVSVVLASYNGEEFIREQVQSILVGLKKDDELIISDDGSTDGTVGIIRDLIKLDKRVVLVNGPAKGVVKNFENALSFVTGDIVFFADQDDLWDPEKIKTVTDVFSDTDVWLVLHDMYLATSEQIKNNERGTSSFSQRKRKHGVFYNFLYNGYYGCCMAMNKQLLNIVLPFPEKTKMYDQLIGLVAEKHKKSFFLDKPLITHRIHGSNMSKKRNIIDKIKYRLNLLSVYRSVKKRERKTVKSK